MTSAAGVRTAFSSDRRHGKNWNGSKYLRAPAACVIVFDIGAHVGDGVASYRDVAGFDRAMAFSKVAQRLWAIAMPLLAPSSRARVGNTGG
jgi:hypothetical protein